MQSETMRRADRMASWMDEALAEGKKTPSTWEEMASLMGRDPGLLNDYIGPLERYAFVKEKVSLWQGANVLLMMRSPFRDSTRERFWNWRIHGLTKPGRMVIYHDTRSSRIRASFVSEKEIQRAFAEAGATLPDPDGLGPHPHEIEYRKRQIIKLVVALFIGALAFFLYWTRPGKYQKKIKASA